MGENARTTSAGHTASKSNHSNESTPSARSIIERMVIAELDSGRFTHRAQVRLLKLAREHRVSDDEVRRIVEKWRETNDFDETNRVWIHDFVEGGVVGKLILLGLLIAAINVIWALLT